MKYQIDDEFWLIKHFKTMTNPLALDILSKVMKPPKKMFRDPNITVTKRSYKTYDGESQSLLVITPKGVSKKAPCLIYIHGGGFMMEASYGHYRNCVRYAKITGCVVICVQYRLAPQYPFPIFFKDVYAAVRCIYRNAKTLGIDPHNIGFGGDSAGGTLSVGALMMAKDRGVKMDCRFLMLPYPFLDSRNNSESAQKYTDTPMWNSTLTKRAEAILQCDINSDYYKYISPIESDDVSYLPPTYIETAEFDPLHDDGTGFAEKLREAGVPVVLNETKGTIHGFDNLASGPITRAALTARIEFMIEHFR